MSPTFKRSHLLVVMIASGLFVRCDCGCWPDRDDDHKDNESDERSLKSASYGSVGEGCLDDFSSDDSWGCGGADDSETCAQNLLCCPNPAYNSYTAYGSSANAEDRYICVASSRCASSDPGDWCSSHRDCPNGYDCVGDRCRAPVDERCNDDDECTTSICRHGYCSYPIEPDAGWLDAGWFDALEPDSTSNEDADVGAGVGDLALDDMDAASDD